MHFLPTLLIITVRKNIILVKNTENEIMETISSWESKESIDEGLIEEWSQQGLAFWNSAQGTRSMHIAESKQQQQPITEGKPDMTRYAANTYVKVGTEDEPVFIKASKTSTSTTASLQGLIESGSAFKNLTSLAVQENIINRADGIATKLQNEYSMTSPEWKRWISLTDSYNATSLQHVMAAYYQDYTIADVGRNREDYVPRLGYPGTLAPGQKFKDNYAIDDLPQRVLHPWPAMQQFRWHVRMPVTHPMIPPPLLWLALNDMYTQNFTEWQMNEECDEVVGGTYMTPKDALRIARGHRLGAAYEETEQIPHGGSLFTGGHKIPFYDPDHGPTIPVEESDPPIPKELIPITTRWVDPHYGMEVELTKSPAEQAQQDDEQEEEEQRRQAAIRLGLISDGAQDLRTHEQEQGGDHSSEVTKLEGELTRIITDRRKVLYSDVDDEASGIEMEAIRPPAPGYEDDPEAYLDYGVLPPAEESVKEIVRAMKGRARNRVALIDYSIATVRDLKTEVHRVEKDSVSRKKSGRRRNTRKKTSAEDDE
jgi:hypothetical protein